MPALQHPIRAIIFDFGGVFSREDDLSAIGKSIAKKYHAPVQKIQRITAEGWIRARVDPRHDIIFWRKLAEALGISTQTLKQEYLTYPLPLPEMAQLARHLKSRYRLAMLSNQIRSWHQPLMTRWQLRGLFRPIITSYQTGYAKPDRQIYTYLLKRLRLPPEDCLFIDDRTSNLIPARTLGMDTILFQNLKQLKHELRKRGIHS